ncbi:hypothetical protein C1645_765000 [Glomus cerebriforme]|uniref:START domain-containing protein n=1 Tax=Glomus cerebriforme TaxID=658196 RepID=A0A397TC05_9GLOM|nr:hypothetical protein C1645_765000 [Glomus cerebriforme]
MTEVYTHQSDDYYDEEYVEQIDLSEEESALSLDLNRLTPQYHIQQAEMALYNLKIIVKETGWKKILQHKSGAVVYSKPGTANDKLPVFMGEHIIEGFAPQAIFAVVGMRKLWDDWYEEGNLVENLDETTSLTYMVMQALAGSKARDLSLVEKIDCTQNGTIYFAATSVETPKVPRVINRIRAHINLNGWILEPLSYNPPRTRAIYVLQTKVKGWVPSILSKTYLTRRPLVLYTIDQYLQKNGPPPMVISGTPPESTRSGTPVYQSNNIQSNVDLPEVKYPRKKISFTYSSGINSSPNKQNGASPGSPIHTTREIQNGSLSNQDTPKSSSTALSMSPVEPLSPTGITENVLSSPKNFAKPMQHRHTEAVRKAFETFKSHVPMDGWKLYSENDYLKIYTKETDGKSTPILRGDGVISGGFSTFDILSIIKNLDMRKLWDDRYDDGATYEMFSLHEILSRTAMKGTFPVSGRDLSVCGMVDHDEDTGILQFVGTSVVDPLIPEGKKHVRAHLEFAGWQLKPHFDSNGKTTSVDVIYIVDIDIKLDTIPTSIRKTLSVQIPMVIFKINELMQNMGFPPYVLNSTTKVIKEQLNIKNHQYNLSLIAKGGSVIEFKISKLMYPNGVNVSTIPENCKVELLSNSTETIRVTLPPRVDLDTLMITTTKLSKGFQMTYNHGQTIPIVSNFDSNGKQLKHATNGTTSENTTLVANGTVNSQFINDASDLRKPKKMSASFSKSVITNETFVKPSEGK